MDEVLSSESEAEDITSLGEVLDFSSRRLDFLFVSAGRDFFLPCLPRLSVPLFDFPDEVLLLIDALRVEHSFCHC